MTIVLVWKNKMSAKYYVLKQFMKIANDFEYIIVLCVRCCDSTANM